MLRQLMLTTSALFLCALTLTAQETWSLEKCIQYARENSLTMQQAEYNIESARLSLKQNQFSRLPSVNGSTSGGYQFGRTIDPTTNTFNTETIIFNSFNLGVNVSVFNGFQINNSIKQSQYDLEASRLDAQAASNDLSLQIASAYLSILLAQEQLDNARVRLEQSQEQLENTDKLIQAGSLPANERLDFVAQIARDQQAIIEAENAVAVNYLTLKQLMEVDPSLDFRIERPGDIPLPQAIDPDQLAIEEVYTTALGTQPQIEAANQRLQSALVGVDLARASMLPSLGLFGNLNTNYSSISRDFLSPNFDNAEVVPQDPIPVLIDGEDALLTEFSVTGVTFPKKDYLDQIDENFGQNFGVQLQVPIYNRHRNRIAMDQARVRALNQEVNNRQQKQQLKTDVQRAIADARAAKRSLDAAERSVEAAQAAFDNAQRRFDLGAINSLEFTTARNNLEQAKVSLIQAKYQYVFNVKTVEFYLGRPLRLTN